MAKRAKKKKAVESLIVRLKVPSALMRLVTAAAKLENKSPIQFVLDAVTEEAQLIVTNTPASLFWALTWPLRGEK